jgi:signal transduction histidine kinase
LSRRIVADHGGRLELDPAAGPGACFRVWLPAAPEGARDA